jgi:hypothetical protein
MIERWRRRKEDRGAALVWVAGTLVILLTMAAFATDLGWILLWNSRLQAAADAAALAGVVNLPGDEAGARADAELAASANRFPIGAGSSMTDQVIAENEYRVTLDTDVDTFFLRLIGFDTFHLSQTSHAQYVKPVRLGSPDNQFGGPPAAFWAAINAQYTEIQQGDPYASRCTSMNNPASSPGCRGPQNSGYRSGGYYYGIEVSPGASDMTVSFFDPGHYVDTGGGSSSAPGDLSWAWNWPVGQRGVYLEYNLFRPDATPTDPTDNNALECSGRFPVNDDFAGGSFNAWNPDCFVGGSLTEGVWVLQLPAPLWEGSTKFGIRATASGPTPPKVYGILDMSIYVNFNGGSATPYLAEIRPEHEGKLFELDIWDLGDNDGSASIQIRPPSGTWACTYNTPGGGTASSSNCTIDISNQRYNARWLNIDIQLDGYSCTTANNGCWWTAFIQSSGQAHDRTTWTARVSGDPVSIVD